MHLPVVPIDGVEQQLEVREAIVVVAKDGDAVHSAGGDMEEAVGQLGAQNPGHSATVAAPIPAAFRGRDFGTQFSRVPSPKQPRPRV
jgi:hypothetical protein